MIMVLGESYPLFVLAPAVLPAHRERADTASKKRLHLPHETFACPRTSRLRADSQHPDHLLIVSPRQLLRIRIGSQRTKRNSIEGNAPPGRVGPV